MSFEDSLRSLSLDYLNLLINGQAFSDVTFSVEGKFVHAHRCILAARSHFFRKFFCSGGTDHPTGCGSDPLGSRIGASSPTSSQVSVIPVNSVGYEVFLLVLQFMYSGHVSIVPQKHEPRHNCSERGCSQTHCTSAVDLALDTLSAARSFGVEQLVLLIQKQLAIMIEKASVEDVMKVLLASRKQDMRQLWTTCSNLVAKSDLPPEILAKHIPIDVVAKIEQIRFKSTHIRRSLIPHHHPHLSVYADLKDQKIRQMKHALDSSDVELVKLMVMGEGLNLDEALALHYAVENCSREVVKALLELGAADVNYPAGPFGKTPLHVAAEMVSSDMVSVLLDHHADPNVRTIEGITPLDILRTLTTEFLFKGAVPGLTRMEPNKLRLCLELVQSAALVISREEGNAGSNVAQIYPQMNDDHHTYNRNSNSSDLNLDSRLVHHHYRQGSSQGNCDASMYHYPHHEY